ncbi:MAG: cyclic nucleotide-binding protein [Flavobacteriaceae bacterium]|nr:MAG: cyclic nucleotide-binding protein [Flavobacteriaceae bacterium]
MIAIKLLQKHGASIKTFKKGAFIFEKNDLPLYYFQVVSGLVKINNFNDQGKEFIQGFFKEGSSFGEPALLANMPYPSNAEVVKNTVIIQLPKTEFLELMTNPIASIAIVKSIAKRLYFKSLITAEISYKKPPHIVLTLLEYIKATTSDSCASNLFKIALTRQEIASLTGLRVETVIRAIKLLETQGAIQIINRKVYL